MKLLALCLVILMAAKIQAKEFKQPELDILNMDTTYHEFASSRQRRSDVVNTNSQEYSGDCPEYCSDLYTTGCDGPDGNCVCIDGYFNDGKYCVKGQTFGGQMVFTDEFNSDNYMQTKDNIESIIGYINADVSGYVGCKVKSLNSGSTLATYQITTDDTTTYAEVNDALNQTLNSCENGTQSLAGTSSNMTLNCTQTEETGLDAAFLCDTQCDLNSTNCNAYGSNDQYISCTCKDGYENLGLFNIKDQLMYQCELPFIVVTTTEAPPVTCNDPFGERKVDNTCDCMWGFDGDTCENYWLFTFTIVTSGCVIIIIGLVIGLICNKKKTKKMKKDQELNRIDFTNPFEDFQPSIMRAKVPNLYVNDYLDDSANGGNHANVHSHAYENLSYTSSEFGSGKTNKSQSNAYQTAILQTRNSDPSEYF